MQEKLENYFDESFVWENDSFTKKNQKLGSKKDMCISWILQYY